jgi:hypothetical protein
LSALPDPVFTVAGVPAEVCLRSLDFSCAVFFFWPALHRFPYWFSRVCFQIRRQVLLLRRCGIIFPLGGFMCPRAERPDSFPARFSSSRVGMSRQCSTRLPPGVPCCGCRSSLPPMSFPSLRTHSLAFLHRCPRALVFRSQSGLRQLPTRSLVRESGQFSQFEIVDSFSCPVRCQVLVLDFTVARVPSRFFRSGGS